jgi:hypothetical protein
MKTIPGNNGLLDLVQKARKGTLVLPQFQRNFVWSRDDITGLLESILDGHFIGSFLLLRTDADSVPFGLRPIEGVDLAVSQLRPDAMILDGQQRITSLHYAFSAPPIPLRWTKYPYRFFLDLRKLTEGDLENAIFSDRADSVVGLLKEQAQFERLAIPLTVTEHWGEWLNRYERWLVDRDRDAYFSQYFEKDKPAWDAIMGRVRGFEVPTIEIPRIDPDDPDRLGEVCAIFEKMNSTGVRLSAYDLVTARMYRFRQDGGKPIDVHALWEDAVAEHTHLAEFSDGEPDQFGVYLLRTIALLRGFDAKSKTLITLKPDSFVEHWRSAAAATEVALKRMASTNDDGFGVFDPKWLPYGTMVSPLAALLHNMQAKHVGHHAYDLLKRWYWSSVFLERYAGAVESTIYRDYQDLRVAFEAPDARPAALVEAQARIVENEAYTLRDVSRLNATYRGVMCLVAIRGAQDFGAGDAIEFHELDDHHIFPQAYLRRLPKERRPKDQEINCIVNRTLISSSTNRRISRSRPGEYISKLVPQDREEAILASHLMDAAALDALRRDDFYGFVAARERVLLAEIGRRIAG